MPELLFDQIFDVLVRDSANRFGGQQIQDFVNGENGFFVANAITRIGADDEAVGRTGDADLQPAQPDDALHHADGEARLIEAPTLLDVQLEIAVRAALRRRGTPIGPYDVLIAGCAMARGLTLVTANSSEFSRIAGLTLDDWRTS